MYLHNYNVDEKTIEGMKQHFPRVENISSSKTDGRGKVVLLDKITQQDLIRLASSAYSGYVEVGCDDNKLQQTINQSLRKDTITLSLTTRTFAMIDAARILVKQLEMTTYVTTEIHDRLLNALHEAILRGIILNLELTQWSSNLSDLSLFFEMFYQRLANPAFANRRLKITLYQGDETLGFSVTSDMSANQGEEGKDNKLSIIETLADNVIVKPGGLTLEASFKSEPRE